ncbi:WD40 repeat-like protein [Lentinus tigrinus ALCF2SS1-6]|uniref:WD40 repeat-like protein n=1 Tax=Lentinus tigrinus ALCF2SS1-6 TaxID=1328759 RepID=A0A5C2S9D0_9APHY|nr:WD40 repeat-like protein [Lentinus tigrinus ALCF2SS1-6]
MSDIPYTQTAHLTDGHSKGVTALAFNSDGSLLATAGLDGTLCIWNTSTWTLSDVYYAKNPIVSVAWYTANALICGLEDGVMSSVKITHVSGHWAHLYPVEWLAVRDNLVASGAHRELSVWEWDTNGLAGLVHLVKGFSLPGSDGKTGESEDDSEVLITGVFWAPTMLVVAYLHHGIRLFDTEDWKNVANIDTQCMIVSSSLSPNGAYMAISDPARGFTIYDLDAAKAIRTFEHDIGGSERAVPVLFVHGGHAILSGSMVGRVNIWYINASFKLPYLPMPSEYIFTSVVVCIVKRLQMNRRF